MNAIADMLLPSSLVLLGGAAGLVLTLTGLRKAALTCFLMGFASLAVFGCGPVAYALMGNLEQRHPPLVADEAVPNVDVIVVLAGYAVSDEVFPVSSRVDASTAFRLAEAIRLWRRQPSTQILISGADVVPGVMAEFLESQGVPAASIRLDYAAGNTHASARNLRPLLQDRPFLLVTSAGHMPRSVAVFQAAGTDPIPAPTDYQVSPNPFAASLIPSWTHLRYSDLAVHEYLGLAWYRLNGYTAPEPEPPAGAALPAGAFGSHSGATRSR